MSRPEIVGVARMTLNRRLESLGRRGTIVVGGGYDHCGADLVGYSP